MEIATLQGVVRRRHNASDEDAHVRITLYFADRDPVGPYQVAVPARRTRLDSRQAENALLSTMAFPLQGA